MKTDLERVSLSLKALIKHEALNDNNNINISLDAPDAYFISRLGENPEVNIYLTQIEERLAVRHSDGQQWQLNGNGLSGTIQVPPRFIQAHFLLTVWSKALENSALIEQSLLSNLIQALGSHDGIPEQYAKEVDSDYQPLPWGYSYVLLDDPEDKRSQGEFWNALGGHPKPSLSLRVTVPMRVGNEITEPSIVSASYKEPRSRDLPVNDGDSPGDWKANPAHNKHYVAVLGNVSTSSDAPLTQLIVHARNTVTDKEQVTSVSDSGRYHFRNLAVGEYNLWVTDGAAGDENNLVPLTVKYADDGIIVPEILNLEYIG